MTTKSKPEDQTMADEIESVAQNDQAIVKLLEEGRVQAAVEAAANHPDFMAEYPRGSRAAARVLAVNSLKESYGDPKMWKTVNGSDEAAKLALLERHGDKTPHQIRHALEKQMNEGKLARPKAAPRGVKV
jgi:hypothetical protein